MAQLGPQTVLVPQGNLVLKHSGAYVPTAEFYDIGRGTWFETMPMALGRLNPGVVVLQDGVNVFVAGGSWGYDALLHTNTTEIYNSQTQQWMNGPSMELERAYNTAVLTQNGDVLIFGTYGSTSVVELFRPFYDPNSTDLIGGTFVTLKNQVPLPLGGTSPAFVVKALEAVMIVCNLNDLQPTFISLRDPKNAWNAWLGSPMSVSRQMCAAAALDDNRIFVSGGGSNPSGGGGGSDESAEIYNVLTGMWTIVARMPIGLITHQAFVFPEQNIVGLFLGYYMTCSDGYCSSQDNLKIYLYDASADEWTVSEQVLPYYFSGGIQLDSHRVLLMSDYVSYSLCMVFTL